MKLIYRAFIVTGIVHGGGGISFGNWQRSFKEANKDLKRLQDWFSYGFSDLFKGIEVQKTNK